jgi:transposase-like protein
MRGESRTIWAKRVERWAESGLSSKEFAAEIGVNARTLVYWKYRFGREAEGTWPAKSEPTSTTAPTFVEVTDGELERPLSPSLEVATGSWVVRVPDGFSEATLVRVLDVLERRR